MDSNDDDSNNSGNDESASSPRDIPPVNEDPKLKLLEVQKYNPKKYKRGILYISFIPPGMNAAFISHYMSKFGKVGRIKLQPADGEKGFFSNKKGKKKKYKRPRSFSEGWIEFLKKRTAKEVAAALNNMKVGGKKSCKFHDCIWNLKYLPRFKWVHLTDRLAHEKEIFKKRMDTEISQAKRVASHFKDSVERSKKMERKLKKLQEKSLPADGEALSDSKIDEKGESKEFVYTQKKTSDQKRKKKKNSVKSREEFLKGLFS